MMLILMLKFCVKESPNLFGLENFWAAGFSITVRLGWCSPYQSKSDQIFTQPRPTPQICTFTKFLHYSGVRR